MKNINKIREKNIEDFSNQWILQSDLNNGYWSDKKWIENICDSIFDLSKINNKNICEVGSGSGRIVRMLNEFKPKKIYCVEPSKNINILKNNLKSIPSAKIINLKGDEYKLKNLDYVFSIGVIHHIYEPISTLKNINNSLKTNGKFIMWVYGYEGNEIYYVIYKFFNFFAKRLNDTLLDFFSSFLNVLILPYIYLSKISKYFPMHSYLKNIFSKCSFKHRKYIIFDQLNPTYSEYYRKNECLELLKSAGFKDIKIKRHQKYSWVLVGSK